jgi:hypothetical protein
MKSVIAGVLLASMAGVAAADELRWGSSLDEARKSGKPILHLRLLGDLDGKT